MSVLDDLNRHFPGYRSPERLGAWEATRTALTIDSTVQGIVVERYPFGVFVDIGVGFPALLEVVFMEGLSKEQCQAGDWYPPGSSVSAFISGFNRDDTRQIGLWQKRPEWHRQQIASTGDIR